MARSKTTSPPARFDPLQSVAKQELGAFVNSYIRKQVLNVLESYHGRLDAFIEAIQNAIDAIEKRWKTWDGGTPPDGDATPDELPRLVINIDVHNDLVSFMDNGSGLDAKYLKIAFAPHVTPKSFTNEPSRGHKGIGTTFLAYGHNLFEFHTKSPTLKVAYRVSGGLDWAKGTEDQGPPEFEQLQELDEQLAGHGRGSLVRVKLGAGTTYGRLKGTFYNDSDMWAHVLRTHTAIGYVAPGTEPDDLPWWVRKLQVDLNLQGVPTGGVKQVPVGFHYPHLDHPADLARELQWLQNHPGTEREFELIYVERDHPALRQLLRDELRQLRESSDPVESEIPDQFDRYEVSAYAALACRNTFFDKFVRAAIGHPEAERVMFQNVDGGLLAASASMPVGYIGGHLNLFKPEERRRYFLLIHFNHLYRPDPGRKLVPQELEPLTERVEKWLMELLRRQAGRLIRDSEDVTHKSASFQDAQEKLKEEVKRVHKVWEKAKPVTHPIPVQRRAEFEGEVAACFYTLLATGRLPGYRLLGIPGNVTRYDALFEFRSDTPEPAKGAEVPLGIHAKLFVNGVFTRSDQWLEVKVDLADLLEEFTLGDGDPRKKYFEQVNLAVVWQARDPGDSSYSVEPVDRKNWIHRNFYGSTHLIRHGDSRHTVEVIELKSLLDRLFP